MSWVFDWRSFTVWDWLLLVFLIMCLLSILGGLIAYLVIEHW